MKALPLLLLCAFLPLTAQELTEFQEGGPATSQHGSLLLGARVLSGPSYLGSDRNRTTLGPIFNAELGRFYLGSSRIGVGFGGGMHLLSSGGLTWDLGLGVGDGRPESRSPVLAGMGDQRATLWAGTGLQWRQRDGWRAGLTLAQGLRDQAGTRSTLSLGKAFRLAPKWGLSAGLHGTWSNAQAMGYDFGISQDQAQTRAALVAGGEASLTPGEIGPYSPRAGFRDFGGSISLGYRPAPRWLWNLSLFGGDLQGDARTSPLVLRNAYLSVGTGVAYRF